MVQEYLEHHRHPSNTDTGSIILEWFWTFSPWATYALSVHSGWVWNIRLLIGINRLIYSTNLRTLLIKLGVFCPKSWINKSFKQLKGIEAFKVKIDELLAEGYNPILDDGVGKNIAPLQKKKMIPGTLHFWAKVFYSSPYWLSLNERQRTAESTATKAF